MTEAMVSKGGTTYPKMALFFRLVNECEFPYIYI